MHSFCEPHAGHVRGPDAVWAAARHPHRHHPLLLGAALVVFVAAVVTVTAISLSMRTTDDSQPFVTTPRAEITATSTGAELATSVTISGPELEPGSVVTARATITNISASP